VDYLAELMKDPDKLDKDETENISQYYLLKKGHCYPKVLLNPQITFVIVYKQVDLEKLC
jgi:hypothetical protein